MKMNVSLIAAALAMMAGAAQAQVLSAGSDAGQYCREYIQTVTIAGKTQKGYGTACLQPDGSWRIAAPEAEEQAAYDTAADGVAAYDTYNPDSITYVVEGPQVVMVPPEPFVYGDVWFGGQIHHFDRDFRPGRGRDWHGRGHSHRH